MPSLSQFFDADSVIRDASFESLGYVDASAAGTLVFSDGIKYVRMACQNPSVTCLITTAELAKEANEMSGLVVAASPREAFYKLHRQWVDENRYRWPLEAHRGVNCQIHSSAIVHEGCWIGDHVIIKENVVIREPVRIGNNVIVEACVRLGMEGILYNRTLNGPRLISHGGYVEIEDHVALMSGSTVVRSVHDTSVTRVGCGSIIGLNSVVGHEARVGAGVVVSNQCVLARRCEVGDETFIGTGAFIREHVKVGARAQIMAGSVVINDVMPDTTVSGNFATDHKLRIVQMARELRSARRPTL